MTGQTAILDMRERWYCHRQLFQQPMVERMVFPPDPRLEEAKRLSAGQRVTVRHGGIRETLAAVEIVSKVRNLRIRVIAKR